MFGEQSGTISDLIPKPMPPVPEGNVIIPILLYVCLFVIWLSYRLNPIFLRNKSRFVTRKKDRASLYSSSFNSQVTSFILYGIVYLVGSSIFYFLALNHFKADIELSMLSYIMLGILLYHLAKYLIYRVVFYSVFALKAHHEMVVQSYMFITIATGLLLTPAAIGLMFTESSVIFLGLGVLILVAYFVTIMIRMFYIFFSGGVSLIYLILYLCTLEIAPILVVSKLALDKLIYIV